MNIFFKNRSQRESVISSSSSLSKDSVDSQSSNSVGNEIENNQSKEKTSCSERLLFFGPLVLFLVLLISGVVVFIIIQQQISKHRNESKFSDEDYFPLICSFVTLKENQATFVRNHLKCGLTYSSIFHIYYSNNIDPIKTGENLTETDIVDPPKIKLNYEFLSKVSAKSFVLILIVPDDVKGIHNRVAIQWIRYYSLSLDDEEDVCCYKSIAYISGIYSEFIFLLYATNSSQIILRVETFCNDVYNPFELDEYITLVNLTLIASTNIFVLPEMDLEE